MVSWVGVNSTIGLERTTGFGDVNEPNRALFSLTAYKLASPGSVDVGGVTRFQYLVSVAGEQLVNTSFNAFVTFNYVAGDFTGMNPNLTATAFLAPASAFGVDVTPTPAQIIAASVQVVRGQGSTGGDDARTTPGTLELIFETTAQAWTPNTKYWYLVTPTHVANMASTPSIANDPPLGDVNVNGRALSFWTNRTPEAPVITSPVGQVATFAGSEIDFIFSSDDPDRLVSFPGDVYPFSFADMAGVHVQYAPLPTVAEPTPEWIDLPIANTDGSALGRGWYIEDSVTAPANDGAKVLWETGKMKIRCGSSTLTPGAAALPSGDWQIRARTFDYGHPFSTGTSFGLDNNRPPLNDVTHSYTADDYPETNTSPWSESVLISVTAQVPPPVPVSPVGGVAIIEDEPVTLVWQYRNTYSPPYAQAERTVQIRQVGEVAWITLVNEEVSASTSYLVTGYDLVSGNQYEWRVQVTDASGLTSAFSDTARFWVVPIPGSGEVIPSPGENIEGATLGCGTHRIEIFRRGGLNRVGEIRNVSSVEWNRVRDDISTSKIVVSGWDIDCGNLLAQLQPWAYEVVIFRDNGYSVDRVWEGPITLLTYEVDAVTIHAKDVMGYAYRRIIRQAVSDFGTSPTAGASVTDRAARVLMNAFAPDDPNILSYLQVLAQPDDAKQYRSTPAYSRTAFEEVDDMAANAGLDYTAVGRAILLWGTKHRIGTLPEFRDKDLGSPPIVSVYGMSMSNVYVVSDGNGIYGEANRLNEDGEDPTYGLVEVLSSTWASDSADDTGTYTQEGLETIRESFAEAAERSISDRYPPPVVVRVPDNTRLNPDTVLSIQHLVPGVVVPLRSTGTLRTVVATQKLDAVKVVEQDGEEAITITLSPFSRDDVEAVEGEGA